MKMIKFYLLKNNKGSVLIFNIYLMLVLVVFLAFLIRINYSSLKVLEQQNKQDAHALSLISLYVYTLNQVTYINKKLKELSFINSLIKNIPSLKALSAAIDAFVFSLKKYQDFLLIKLKVEAKIIDLKLKKINKLNLNFNYHFVNYRRQNKLFSLFTAELIEIKEDVFNTACIKNENIISKNSTCVYNLNYENEKNWFAPLDNKWTYKIYAK